MKIDYEAKYKELELEFKKLEKRHDAYIKHRRHNPKECEYCPSWYKEVIEETKLIKDVNLRNTLLKTWETLWDNNCGDFDIIAHEFEVQ